MVDMLLEKFPSSDVFIMYDIACTLQKHLKVCVTNAEYHASLIAPL